MVLMEVLVALLQARPEDGKDLALMVIPRRAPATTLVIRVVLTLVVLLHRLALMVLLQPAPMKALVVGVVLTLVVLLLLRPALVKALVAGEALVLTAGLMVDRTADGKFNASCTNMYMNITEAGNVKLLIRLAGKD
ncbi:hypothetical protein N7486_010829 [Penicillium sp. IBT 16267x]|nr:hypothetical protein N7486_010829 [Penicillium sp. IBT 16267x]